MKFTPPIPTDGKVHLYCSQCLAEGTRKEHRDGKTVFVCPQGHVMDRGLYYGGVKFWLADDLELWHESVAIFVKKDYKFLFFDRTEFPFGIATPAGHVDEHEPARHAAIRELGEETGIKAPDLTPLFTVDIVGDSCSGGSDAHRFHVFGLELPAAARVHISAEEGRRPVWLTIDEANAKRAPFAMHFIMEHFQAKLSAFAAAPTPKT